MNVKLAKRMDRLKASEIRELLKLTEQPGVISFAGGLPAPEVFPIEDVIESTTRTLKENGQKALQYTTTEGYGPLRDWIAERMNKQEGTNYDRDNILITHGSQQVLDFMGKVFIDEGDVVACEAPTYLAAINAFKAYGAQFAEIPTDDEGMIMEHLEKALQTGKVKFIYVIPTFQNPTGRTWSVERRKQLAALADKYGVAILEDNPYGDLRFEGENLPSVKSCDLSEKVLTGGTFSKIFCPGLRIGWIAGDKELIRKFVLVKQGADLQCNTLAQMSIYDYLKNFDIDKHIDKIKKLYKNRRDLALKCMQETFPKEVKFTHPNGGLFTWVELPEGVSARDLLVETLKEKIAFVPGGSFFPEFPKENTFRLNYSNMPEDKIEYGLRKLGEIITNYIKK